MPPVFSIIIPTHNRSHLLPRALRSVFSQSFKDFEIIIIDDASTDETGRVVEGFDDSRIVYHRKDSNAGAPAARNTGIKLARGGYIALLDDDDEYLPEFLNRAWETIGPTPEEVGFTWCGLRWLDESQAGKVQVREEIWQPSYRNREHAYRSFLVSRRIGTNCGLVFKRSIFEKVGLFDEAFLGGAEDTEFLIRLVREYDFRVVPEVLIQIHLHGGTNLRSYGLEKAHDYEKIIAKNQEALQNPRIGAALHYKTGWLYYHGGDKALGRQHMLEALRHKPSHGKTWIALLLFECLGQRGVPVHRWLSRRRWQQARGSSTGKSEKNGDLSDPVDKSTHERNPPFNSVNPGQPATGKMPVPPGRCRGV